MELKEYLRSLDIDDDEKLYTLSYSNKVKYLNSVMDALAKASKKPIDFGYGNINSNVCILYDKKEDVAKYAKLLAKMFDKSGYETWMPYTTFLYKGTTNDLQFLAMEISAIKPKITFSFCSCEKMDGSVRDALKECGTLVPIPEDATNVDDEASMVKAWKYFRKLINYKNKTYR